MVAVFVQLQDAQSDPARLSVIEGKASDECLSLGYCDSAHVAHGLRDLLHRDHSSHGRLNI